MLQCNRFIERIFVISNHLSLDRLLRIQMESHISCIGNLTLVLIVLKLAYLRN